MKALTRLNIKIFLFCFLLISLQISTVTEFMGFSFNFPFACIIVFASLLSLYEATLTALIFMIFVSMFSYDSQILWIYPVLAILGTKLNPSNIDDKFLVCIVYVLIFTPLLELFNPSSLGFLARTLNSSLSTIITAIPLFFLVKVLFKRQKNSGYPSLQ